ncbi:MAG: hypothetical protein WC661_21985, partial [Opitutaceae bacterium]
MANIEWEIIAPDTIAKVTFKDDFAPKIGLAEDNQTASIVQKRIEFIQRTLHKAKTPITGKIFKRLSAERDISPETARVQLTLSPNGQGATNIIRRYITTSDPEFPCEVIQNDLLEALNEVFGCDGQFTEVIVRHHDDKPPQGIPNDTWEVFLGQKKKGPVALILIRVQVETNNPGPGGDSAKADGIRREAGQALKE